ncbi:DUF6236 family protein [Arcobacter sp. L]|uniref:DUF6236 family protein n=1 Tax=Arcobacter sp. L TaxID=944547 RepID=UPI0002296589|nr:DUF6236 family protein [Arcobacter sp. L]BAK73249.1 hypothetical protein ABLL_1374 [Arcobacter sp. L]
MNKNAIYFPYIDIPESKWLTETLLYWDKLYSIAPYEYTVNKDLLSKSMNELKEAKFIELIQPMEYEEQLKYFFDDFLIIAENWYKNNKNNYYSYSRIHLEKLSSISNKLKKMGIIKEADYYPWVLMPTPLSNTFMSGLATQLSHLSKIKATVLTDLNDKNNIPLIQNELVLNEIRENILNEILPVPTKVVSIKDIIDFKNKYGYLLNDFRTEIEKVSIEILNMDKSKADYEEIKISELKKQMEEIKEAMNTSIGDIVIKGIMPLVGGGLTALSNNNNLSILGGSLILGSSAYTIYSEINKRNNDIKKPLAYATYASQKILL